MASVNFPDEKLNTVLKSALRARFTGPNWLDELPWVLLGIHIALKEDLKCSSAEFIYGAPITVPGGFIATPQGAQTPANILPQLRDTVNKFVPVPTTCHDKTKTSMPSDLQSSNYVFIHCDTKRSPLQCPYEGLFHVLEKGPKFFKIDFGSKADTVSVNHLKPAHLDRNYSHVA